MSTVSGAVADRLIKLYRSRHRITPVQLEINGPTVCEVCGFKVYPIRPMGRWRHDIAQIERMAATADPTL